MSTRWQVLLGRPAYGDHLVQVYEDDAFLAETLSYFVAQGLKDGDGVVVVARAARADELRRRLRGAAIDAADAEARGQLVVLDAELTLAQLMMNGVPDPRTFRQMLGNLLEGLSSRYGRVRAFGEMVDVLWQSADRCGAEKLEALWNEVLQEQRVALFCAYRMDPLREDSYGGPLESLCRHHTHLISARHEDSFDDEVQRASREVLPQPLDGMMHSLAAIHRPRVEMALGQATLLWLKANMPVTGDKVLARLRASRESAERR